MGQEELHQNILGSDTLMELYKVAEENHRFYVAKRFTTISLYFPLMTLILSGIYVLAESNYRILICIAGFVFTLFLYSLENRNWILSNICLQNSKEIGMKINGSNNLHLKLVQSYHGDLPEGSTFLDRLVRRIARSQHKAVSRITIFLLLYWISLAIISL